MMQEDVDADNITLSGGDGGTRIILSMDDFLDNDINTNITVVQDVEQQLGFADQETQEESISVEEGGMSTKFDAEKDVDGQDNRGVLTGAVGPGIAARVQLLFRDDDAGTQENNITVKEGKKGAVVMNMVNEMNRTVLIRRRARRGQARETGIRTPRIDDMFGASQPIKRKSNTEEGKPGKEKRRKFGQ